MVISVETALQDPEDSEHTALETEALARLLAYAAHEAAALDLSDCHYFITMASSRLAEVASEQSPHRWSAAGRCGRVNDETPSLAFATRA